MEEWFKITLQKIKAEHSSIPSFHYSNLSELWEARPSN
jgi:hypothetical protein